MWDLLVMHTTALGGLLAAGGVGYGAASVALAQRYTTGRREPARATPAIGGLSYQDVRFPARGQALQLAAWYLPAQDASGAVVLVHGHGGHKGYEFNVHSVALLRSLLEARLSVLVMDLRGHGDSDPAPITFGSNERLDVLGAVDWLLARGYRAGRIGALGASMGACAVINAAAEEAAIGAIVGDSAFADFHQVVRHNLPRMFRTRLAAALVPGVLWATRRITGVAVHRFRPVELAERLRGRPVLLIHAKGDHFVPAEHAGLLEASAEAQVWISEAGEHLGTFADTPALYIERVCRHFRLGLASA